MKYALVIPDGMADEPQRDLDGKTPLQAANLPNMDEVVRCGVIGTADHVPASMPSGSDVGTMSLFGYDPLEFHTGRAPIEAAAQGITPDRYDWAIRCNLVSVVAGIMESFTAHQISSEMARELLADLQRTVGMDSRWEFVPGVSYRNLLLCRGSESTFDASTRTHPPHDVTDQPVASHLPTGQGGDVLRELMRKSDAVFRANPKNSVQSQSATGIWLWGQGTAPKLTPFRERFGISGAVITAVDLLRGMGRLIGWDIIEVLGATGYLDTDYAAKGAAAIDAIAKYDLVVVHVEATDEASHEGKTGAKIEACQRIDVEIVGPLHAALRRQGPYRLMICPDHPTLLRTKTHSHGPVPFALCGDAVTADPLESYDEITAASAGRDFSAGSELMASALDDNFWK